jgi:hypothetical protein
MKNVLILFDASFDNSDDDHYIKPYIYFQVSTKFNIKIVKFGRNNQYDFNIGTNIFDVIDKFSKDDKFPIIFHLVVWDGLLVSNLDEFNGIKMLDSEDQHEIDYIYKYMSFFNVIVYRYQTEIIEEHKKIYNNHKFVHLSHIIDKNVFTDYKFEKEYDILFSSARNNIHDYPLRHRLYNIISSSNKYRMMVTLSGKITSHSEFSKLINKSWLTVSTPTIHTLHNKKASGCLFKKFIEIPMSKGVLLGNLPDEAINEYDNNYVYVNENMTDNEILDIIDKALSDKNKLKMYSDNLYNKFTENYQFIQGLKKFEDILYYVESTK